MLKNTNCDHMKRELCFRIAVYQMSNTHIGFLTSVTHVQFSQHATYIHIGTNVVPFADFEATGGLNRPYRADNNVNND